MIFLASLVWFQKRERTWRCQKKFVLLLLCGGPQGLKEKIVHHGYTSGSGPGRPVGENSVDDMVALMVEGPHNQLTKQHKLVFNAKEGGSC